MSQNSFIKQYLEKQQELLRQRLEREAREAAELEGKPELSHLTRSLFSFLSPSRCVWLIPGRGQVRPLLICFPYFVKPDELQFNLSGREMLSLSLRGGVRKSGSFRWGELSSGKAVFYSMYLCVCNCACHLSACGLPTCWALHSLPAPTQCVLCRSFSWVGGRDDPSWGSGFPAASWVSEQPGQTRAGAQHTFTPYVSPSPLRCLSSLRSWWGR